MGRARTWAAALALLSLAALPVALGGEPAQERSSSWWSWRSWADDLFGSSFGGVSYGSGGPDRIAGSDRLVHEVRAVSGVRGIELSGPIDLVIKQDANEKLTLHTDDNIAPLIETKVQEGILRVGVRPGANFRTRHAIGVTVALAQLGALKVLGPGDVSCDGLDSDLLDITMGGSGEVRIDSMHAAATKVLLQGSGAVHLSGTSARQDYVIDGSGEVDADELVGRAVAVRVAGSGKARIWATESLSVDISGSGDVHYRGRPALSSSLHGSGHLVHD